jgi:hypothetical protein
VRPLLPAVLALLALAGCSETRVRRGELPDPADPPERELDLWGTPPSSWQDCFGGLRGLYYNLTPDHPDVGPEALEPVEESDTDLPPDGLDAMDWWEGELAFQRYDGTTDFGPNWWPVDGGFAGDPQHFAVRWVGWLRVTDRGQHDVVVGASTDLLFRLGDETLIERRGVDDFETETVTLDLDTGVYRLDLRYAHRHGLRNGMRFRVASDDILICYPEFGDDPEE